MKLERHADKFKCWLTRAVAITIFIYGPLNVAYRNPKHRNGDSRSRYLVQPANARMLERQIMGVPLELGDRTWQSSRVKPSELLVDFAWN